MALNIKKIIDFTGFSYDKTARSFHGDFYGIPCTAFYSYDNKYLSMKFYVRNNTLIDNGAEDTFLLDMQNSLAEIKKNHKKSLLQKCYYESYAIVVNLYVYSGAKIEKIGAIMNDVLTLCRDKNLVVCCEKCGIQTNTDYYTVNQTTSSLCDSCYTEIVSELSQNQFIRSEISSNIPLGILGALIGAIVIFALTFIFYKIGYIVYIVGIAGVVFAMYLFNKFSGKITNLGAVLTIVICLAASVISGLFCYAKDLSDVYRDEIAEYNVYVDEYTWIKSSTSLTLKNRI